VYFEVWGILIYQTMTYIRNSRAVQHGEMAWWNRMTRKRMSRHEEILWGTITLRTRISNIPYLYYNFSNERFPRRLGSQLEILWYSFIF
jgi:hypothetical protein